MHRRGVLNICISRTVDVGVFCFINELVNFLNTDILVFNNLFIPLLKDIYNYVHTYTYTHTCTLTRVFMLLSLL